MDLRYRISEEFGTDFVDEKYFHKKFSIHFIKDRVVTSLHPLIGNLNKVSKAIQLNI